MHTGERVCHHLWCRRKLEDFTSEMFLLSAYPYLFFFSVIISLLLHMKVKETCSQHYSMKKRHIQYITIRCAGKIVSLYLLLHVCVRGW